jgi:CheY-like chemotaxis protein
MAKKVLIVDDDPDILVVSAVRLRKLGYEVSTARDTTEALDIITKITPDLILLDLIMPKMRGDEFCKSLKVDDRYKHIPIILFTASVGRANTPENLKAVGADDCLFKPFEGQELIERVKKWIE